MLNLIGLSLALVAIILLVIAILKVTYHLAVGVFSLRKETRFIAYMLGPFSFLRRNLFDLDRQQHVKRAILWSIVLLAALGLVIVFYPTQ